MTIYGTDTLTAKVEQMLAYGRSLAYIIDRLGVTEEDVFDISDRMNAAAAHEDDPAAPFGDTCRKRLHDMTPENTYTDPRGWNACRACKRATRRACYERERKAS